MINFSYLFLLTLCLIMSGCRGDSSTPSEEEYRQVLMTLKNAPGGPDIDVSKEMDEFRSSSDEKKRKLYFELVEEL